MKIKFSLLLFVFSLLSIFSYSQKELVTDSLLEEMCISLKNSTESVDSIKVVSIIKKHLLPLLENAGEKEFNDAMDAFFYRFQRQCIEFYRLLTRNSPEVGDWEEADSKPVSELNKEICSDFNTRKNYYYLQNVDDTVRVTIDQGLWIEEFKDGTYSKLEFKWVGDCEFELVFISSNNKFKKNLSKKGEQYRYELLQKNGTVYKTSAMAVGRDGYSTFKIYY